MNQTSSPPLEKNGIPPATWPIALVLCGLAQWAQAGLASVDAFGPYALGLGVGLLLVQWWGYRVVACYVLSAAIAGPLLGLSGPASGLGDLMMNSATLFFSRWFYHPRGSGTCWMPDLPQSLRFIIAGIFIPYALTRLAGLPVIAWTARHADAASWHLRIQNDLFAFGGALFWVTLPGLLLLTRPLEKAGWARPWEAISPPFSPKGARRVFGLDGTLPFLAYAIVVPLAIPIATGWYFFLLIPLWAAISHPPIVVILSVAWSLATSFAAARLLHPLSPYADAMGLTASSIGLMTLGLVAFLLSCSINTLRNDNRIKQKLHGELKESLNTLINAFLSSPEATVVSRFSDGMMIDVNPVIEDVLGYSRAEMVGADSAALNLWVHASHRKDWIKSLADQGWVQAYETDLRHKSGTILPCVISARQFPLDGEVCIISTVRLNLVTKKMEKELERSRALYREAQTIAHLGHWELDIQGGDLLWSDEIYAIFEINSATHTPSYALFLNLIHPDDREMVRHEFNNSVNTHTPYETIHRLKMPDGRIKYVHERGHTQYDPQGRPLRTIGTVQDVSTYKEMEMEKEKTLRQLRQSQKLESVGTLASGIAHDFNNILSAILGYAEISLDPLPEDKQLCENLYQIRDAGIRARDLVRQLLTFCRKHKQVRQPVMVKPIVKESVKFLRASLPATIRINEALASEAAIMGDATQIHQVIMNLCTNAAQAMAHGGGVLGVELSEAAIDKGFSQRFIDMPAGRYLKLMVEDTGHGMDAKTRDRIFDPFFTTKKEGEGSGLGLSVVHGIVSSHDGQIIVYSEPGLGTSFSLFFPIIDAKTPQAPKEEPPLPRGTEHLLVVDDEHALVELMRLMLTALGYRVTTASCPATALALFREQPDHFHALITDMTMPKMTGIELTEKIRTLRKGLPVIVCSGFSDNLSKEVSSREMPIKALLKPLDRRTLATALRQALDA